MTLDMKAAVKVFDGELQLLHVTVQPALVLDGKYSIRGEVSKSVRKHLFTVYTTPIPIAPGLLLCPEIEFEGGISVGASLKFTTNLKFVHSFGMYGFSYNNGDGFTFRHRVTPPGEDEGFSPSVDGFEGYLYASANLYVTPSVSLYGLIGAGVETNLGLTFSLTSNGEGSKLALSPSIEFMPKVASLGGLLSHTFKELTASIPLDPIWERWFTPNWTRRGLTFQYVMTEDYYMIPGCYYFPLPCGLKADYDFVLKNATLFDYDVAIDVYEAITPIPWNLLGPSYATFGTGDGEKTVYFSDFLEGGYEHLWPFLVGHYLTYRNAEWKFVDRILVGKFKKGCEEEQKFSGEVPYSFQSGKLYRLAGRLPGYYDTSAAFGDTAIEQDLATLPLFYWPTTGTGALYEPLSNGH